jgi:hypothetical protein
VMLLVEHHFQYGPLFEDVLRRGPELRREFLYRFIAINERCLVFLLWAHY